MPTNASAGKLSILVVGGTTMEQVSGSFKGSADEIDVTNTTSGGFYECIAGIVKGSLNADCIWNSEAHPGADPPGIIEGEQVAVSFSLVSGKAFTGTVQFADVTYNTDVKGAVKYSFSATFTGTYTRPT